MTTTIILMRHGHVYNPGNILYGRLPRFRLSDEGVRFIKSQVSAVKALRPEILYTSPLLRARQTGKIIADELGLKPKISPLLIEVKLFRDDITLAEFEGFQERIYDKEYIAKGEESADSIGDRMLTFISRMHRRHAGRRILAVSHGDPIVILRAALSHESFTWQYKISHYIETGHFITVECTDAECRVTQV